MYDINYGARDGMQNPGGIVRSNQHSPATGEL